MITIVAAFKVKPECVEEFKTLAADCIMESRAEEGNVDYNLYISKDSENRFCFIENWKDEKAIELHNQTAHFKKFSEGFVPLLASRPRIDQLEKL